MLETIYLVCLLVGGFFVTLSVLGGDTDADMDVDVDVDVDIDADIDTDVDFGASTGFIDLLSIRALFLFATFFGLIGTALTWLEADPTLTLALSIGIGLITGLGGNYVIKRYGQAHVSSDVAPHEIQGKTGKVLLPFEAGEKGKISLVVKGTQLRLVARALDDASTEQFKQGEEVVVIRTESGIAEIVKIPD